MIVWSGRGLLSVIVLLVSFFFFNSIIPEAYNSYASVLAFFSTGAFSWHFGKKWNAVQSSTFVDKTTGREIVIDPNHSLFWIKMQYWGPIFGIFGLIVLIQLWT